MAGSVPALRAPARPLAGGERDRRRWPPTSTIGRGPSRPMCIRSETPRRGPWCGGCWRQSRAAGAERSSRYNARPMSRYVVFAYGDALWPRSLQRGGAGGRGAFATRARSSSTSRPLSAPRSRSGSRSADGTFLCTVGLTQAVSVRGIGNRPGATQMNSGYHWPYGRREGVLPIWAHRRAAAPGARAVPAHHLPEPARGLRVANVRGLDARSYFCLSFTGEHAQGRAGRRQLRQRVQQRQGPHADRRDVAAGYAEPAVVGRPADGARLAADVTVAVSARAATSRALQHARPPV